MALGKEIHHIKDWLLLDPTATMISADALAAVERACQIDHDGQGHIIVTYFGRFGGCSYINHQREEACCTIICFRGREGKRKVETILNKLSPNIAMSTQAPILITMASGSL